jgi:hypothetical protein
MGAKIQAFDIFQTPLSSHYPLPLKSLKKGAGSISQRCGSGSASKCHRPLYSIVVCAQNATFRSGFRAFFTGAVERCIGSSCLGLAVVPYALLVNEYRVCLLENKIHDRYREQTQKICGFTSRIRYLNVPLLG